MKKVALLAALLAIVLCLAGCGGADDAVFRYAFASHVANLDPQIAKTEGELTVVKNLFSGLFRVDPNGEVQLDVAQDYSFSNGGKTLTINLRQDCFYYNKEKAKEKQVQVTAHDFVYGLQRVFDKNTASPYVTALGSIKNGAAVHSGALPQSELGVRATGDFTLVIDLNFEDTDILKALACPGAMPCNKQLFASTSGTYGLTADTIFGNGPYRITLWNAKGLVMRRVAPTNKSIAKLELSIVEDAAQIDALYNSGAIDGRFVGGSAGDERYATTVWALIINTRSGALANADVRAGIALEVYNYLANSGSTLQGIVPQALNQYGENYRRFAQNVLPATGQGAGAAYYKNGLAQLGLAKYNSATVLLPEHGTHATFFAAVNQQLQKELSAFYSTETVPLAQMQQLIKNGSYDMAVYPLTCESEDVLSLLAAFDSGSAYNITGLSSANFDAALRDVQAQTTKSGKLSALKNAEQLLINSYCVVPLYAEYNVFETKKGFENIAASPFGNVVDFTYATD